MAELTHLVDLLSNRGLDYVQQLLHEYVRVNEKLNLTRLQVERLDSGELQFYGSNHQRPLNLVDRTLMVMYEPAIRYLTEELPAEVRAQIPIGWRFGFEYTSVPDREHVTYHELPKHYLVLCDIQTPEQTVQAAATLQKWADKLQVQGPPIIFEGKLNDEQRQTLLDFLETPYKELLERFRTTSFARFVVSVLNPKLQRSALQDNLDKPIEGVVFRFGEDGQQQVLAKVLDPLIVERQRHLREVRASAHERSATMYFLCLADFTSFVAGQDLRAIKLKAREADERYVELVSKLFVTFLDRYSFRYKGVDFQEPEHLRRAEHDLNDELVPVPQVQQLVRADRSYRSLYKILLNAFRRHRRKGHDTLFPPQLRQMFNRQVDELWSIAERSEELTERLVPSFEAFMRREPLTEEEEEQEATPASWQPQPAAADGTTWTAHPVSEPPAAPAGAPQSYLAFPRHTAKAVRGDRGACVLITCSALVTQTALETLRKETELQHVLLNVQTTGSPFGVELTELMLTELALDEDLAHTQLLTSCELTSVIEQLRPRLEVQQLLVDERVAPFYDHLLRRAQQQRSLNLNPELRVTPVKLEGQGRLALAAVRERNLEQLRHHVPKAVARRYLELYRTLVQGKA